MRVVASCQLPVASGERAHRARTANRQLRTLNWQLATNNWPLRKAFTLTEVMFAVILLGIGFIMVAAMFPVAIQQNRTTSEQTAATQLARAAISNLQQVATNQTMPATAGNVRTNPHLWQAIEGSLTNADDPRFAWTALYAREAGSQFSQVFVFTLQARNRPAFVTEDTKRVELDDTMTYYPANLEPRPVLVRVVQGDPIDQVTIGTPPDGAPAIPPSLRVHGPSMAAEGACIVIANGEQRGRILRIGRPINRDAGIWELAPGGDLPSTVANIPPLDADPPAEAYLMGRGYATPSITLSQPPTPEGPAMDVMIFTGFVRVRQ